MRHAPFFITLPSGDLINVDQITYVKAANVGCNIHFAIPNIYGNSNGEYQSGGSGRSYGSINSDTHSISCALSRAELLALINKEVALVHAMEQAAQ